MSESDTSSEAVDSSKAIVEGAIEEAKIVDEEVKEEAEHFKILKQYGGLESNIPINHHYWRIRP